MSSARKSGLLAKLKVPFTDYGSVYTVPIRVDYSRPLISILNMSDADIDINIFITDAGKKIGLPDESKLGEDEFYLNVEGGYILVKPEDFIDYKLTIKPSGVYERYMVAYDSGETIYMKASAKGLVLRINGLEESILG